MWQFEAENLSFDPKTKVSFSSHQEAYGSTQFQPPNTTPIVWSTAPTNSYLCLRNCAQMASYMSSHQKNHQTVIPKSKREVQRKKVIQQLHKYLSQTSRPLMSLSREMSGWPWAGSVSPGSSVPGKVAAAALCPGNASPDTSIELFIISLYSRLLKRRVNMIIIFTTIVGIVYINYFYEINTELCSKIMLALPWNLNCKSSIVSILFPFHLPAVFGCSCHVLQI